MADNISFPRTREVEDVWAVGDYFKIKFFEDEEFYLLDPKSLIGLKLNLKVVNNGKNEKWVERC